MNSERLLMAMTDIDDRLIVDAARCVSVRSSAKRVPLARLAAMAAAMVLLLGYAVVKWGVESSNDTLPIITLSSASEGGWGYEGYMAYDIADLVSANPWREGAEVATLPVYQNVSLRESNAPLLNEMQAVLSETASRLSLDTSEFENGHVEDDGVEITLVGKSDAVHISVDTSLGVTVHFKEGVVLPSDYHFSHYSTYQEMCAVADYLQHEYRTLIAFADPQVNIYGGNYTIYGDQGYHLEFFNNAATLTEALQNYHFERVGFYCDDEGRLSFIRLFRYDLSKKMGDYPLITASEAKQALLRGEYITSVPHDLTGEETVAKVELIYRTGRNEKYYLPYYRFYVEIPDSGNRAPLKEYGTYYVPAVQARYLNVTTWDGSFNG